MTWPEAAAGEESPDEAVSSTGVEGDAVGLLVQAPRAKTASKDTMHRLMKRFMGSSLTNPSKPVILLPQ